MIETTNAGISYQLRDIESICKYCWNVITYIWKIHNVKIEIISFVVKFGHSLSISMCRFRYGVDLAESVVSLLQAHCDRCDQQTHET